MQYNQLITQLGQDTRTVFELLIVGVAFIRPDHYLIVSHGGDELGTVSIHHVESLVHRLRKLGIIRSEYPAAIGEKPGITYGFGGRFMSSAECDRITDMYWRNNVMIR